MTGRALALGGALAPTPSFVSWRPRLSLQVLGLFLCLHLSLRNLMSLSGTSELRRENRGNRRVCGLVACPHTQPHWSPGEDAGLLTLAYTLGLAFPFLGARGKATGLLWASGSIGRVSRHLVHVGRCCYGPFSSAPWEG